MVLVAEVLKQLLLFFNMTQGRKMDWLKMKRWAAYKTMEIFKFISRGKENIIEWIMFSRCLEIYWIQGMENISTKFLALNLNKLIIMYSSNDFPLLAIQATSKTKMRRRMMMNVINWYLSDSFYDVCWKKKKNEIEDLCKS
jgi:hypothetical protein